jgi:hypothetical protein
MRGARPGPLWSDRGDLLGRLGEPKRVDGREWLGVAYRQYGGKIFDAEEVVARAAGRGVWSSEFVMPWDWRNGER